MDNGKRLSLITRNCQEVLTANDLENLIESKTPLNHYIGFEISGMVHLGTGLMSMGKVADFLKAGVNCTIFLADFHSYLNNKLGGNWENIRKATKEYFQEALVASLACWEVNAAEEVKKSNLRFVMGQDLYKNNLVHWETFMEVGKHVTLSRNLRSISIMGKSMGKDVDMATLFYPPLQVADIFTLGVNIAHAGIDQRKAHVIARQVAPKLKINPLPENISPIAIHQNLIAGLGAPVKGKTEEELKMSKSKPESAIFIHDSVELIKSKIQKAYCPPQVIEFNPVINWMEFLIFWGEERGEFEVKRTEKFGGNKKYTAFSDLKADYQTGKLHPADLKEAVGEWLIKKLAPARKHFNSEKAKNGLKLINDLLS